MENILNDNSLWGVEADKLNDNFKEVREEFPVFERFADGDIDTQFYGLNTYYNFYGAFSSLKLVNFDETKPHTVTYMRRNYADAWGIKVESFNGSTWDEEFVYYSFQVTENVDGSAITEITINKRTVIMAVDWSRLQNAAVINTVSNFYTIKQECYINEDSDYYLFPAFSMIDSADIDTELSEGFSYRDLYQSFKTIKLYGFDKSKPHSISYIRRNYLSAYALKISSFNGSTWIEEYYSGAVYQSENTHGVSHFDETVSGKRVVAEIDWSFITDDYFKVIGTFPAQIEKENFITEQETVSSAKMLAKRVDDKLYIASKYDATQDLIICFQKCMANELMTFSYIQLVSNSDNNITTELEVQTGTLLLGAFNGDHSDNIGPYMTTFSTVLYSVGGNHEQNGNQTAETVSFEFRADGNLLPNEKIIACEKIDVVVRNSMFNGKEAYDTAARNHLFYENVIYRVVEGNIEVLLEMEMTNAATIDRYYGMQLLGHSTWMEKQYFANNSTKTLQPKYNGSAFVELLSDSINANSDLFKTIICNSDKSICCAMTIDRVNGLGDASALTTSESYIRAESTYGKTYFRLVNDAPAIFTSGTRHYWHGCYSFFSNLAENGDNFAYKDIDFQDTRLNTDFLATSSEEVDFNEPLKKYTDNGTDVAVIISSDNNIVMPAGIKATATGYGLMRVKVT